MSGVSIALKLAMIYSAAGRGGEAMYCSYHKWQFNEDLRRLVDDWNNKKNLTSKPMTWGPDWEFLELDVFFSTRLLFYHLWRRPTCVSRLESCGSKRICPPWLRCIRESSKCRPEDNWVVEGRYDDLWTNIHLYDNPSICTYINLYWRFMIHLSFCISIWMLLGGSAARTGIAGRFVVSQFACGGYQYDFTPSYVWSYWCYHSGRSRL